MGLPVSTRRLADRLIHVVLLLGLGACASTSESDSPPGEDIPLPSREPPQQPVEKQPSKTAPPTAQSPTTTNNNLTFCESAKGSPSASSFCADFETDLMAGWSSKFGLNGETVANEHAFVASTSPVPAGTVARAYLRKDFANIALDEVEYTFAVRVEGLGATPAKGGTIAVLQFGELPDEYEVQLSVFAEGRATLSERGPTPAGGGARLTSEHVVPSFVVGQWRRISIRVTTKNTIDVSFDGTLVLDKTPMVAALPTAAPSFYLGVTYVDPPAAPWTIRYDDVAVAVR